VQALSRSSQYAVRALAWLAAQRDAGAYQLVSRIAEEIDVPEPYLGKLLQALALGGILDSRRGRGGGFRLTVEPSSIALLEVVTRVDGGRAERECVLGLHECGEENPCALHDLWKDLCARMEARLAKTTLADLARNPDGLV
jgi:Rrf2 family protein